MIFLTHRITGIQKDHLWRIFRGSRYFFIGLLTFTPENALPKEPQNSGTNPTSAAQLTDQVLRNIKTMAVPTSADPTCGERKQLNSTALLAAEGGDNSGGGGGDQKQFGSGSAWFLGKGRNIKVCYEASLDFGVSPAKIEQEIKSAFATWGSYLETKHQNDGEPGAKYDLYLTTSIQLLSACNGEQDLKLYFGTEDQNVQLGRREYQNPIAFAARTSQDVNKGWSKGFIWVSSKNWVDQNPGAPSIMGYDKNLKRILLHEIGHILGCEHVEGTIMDEDLRFNLSSPHILESGAPQTDRRRWLNEIDRDKELVRCNMMYRPCPMAYDGEIVTDRSTHDPRYRKGEVTFRLFTGKAAQGPIQARLGNSLNSKSPDLKKIELTLTDRNGSTVFPIQFASDEIEGSSGPKVFEREKYLSSENRGYGYWSDGGKSSILFGWVTAKSGKKYKIRIEQNTHDASPVSVLYDDGNGSYDLFSMRR